MFESMGAFSGTLTLHWELGRSRAPSEPGNLAGQVSDYDGTTENTAKSYGDREFPVSESWINMVLVIGESVESVRQSRDEISMEQGFTCTINPDDAVKMK